MTVLTLRLDLRIGPFHSSRDKRRQLQAIMDKLHRHFNVSVAGADGEGGPDASVLVVAAASRTRREARATLERVVDAIMAHPHAEVLGSEITEV